MIKHVQTLLNHKSIRLGFHHVCVVMVSMLTLSAVDCRLETQFSDNKDYKIGICSFCTKHTALRSKRKDLLAWNQDTVFEWSDCFSAQDKMLIFCQPMLKVTTQHGFHEIFLKQLLDIFHKQPYKNSCNIIKLMFFFYFSFQM